MGKSQNWGKKSTSFSGSYNTLVGWSRTWRSKVAMRSARWKASTSTRSFAKALMDPSCSSGSAFVANTSKQNPRYGLRTHTCFGGNEFDLSGLAPRGTIQFPIGSTWQSYLWNQVPLYPISNQIIAEETGDSWSFLSPHFFTQKMWSSSPVSVKGHWTCACDSCHFALCS